MKRVPSWLVAIAVVAVLTAIATALAVLPSGYAALAPYRPLSTQRMVSIEGRPVTAIQCCIYLAGVSERRVTILQKWLLQFDESVSFARTEGTQEQRANRRRLDQALVRQSKRIAAAVAYELLGARVVIDGGGAVIDSIDSTGPAHGILEPGDRIVRANGQPIRTAKDLSDLMESSPPGSVIELGVRRDRLPRVLRIRSRAREGGGRGSRLGVEVRTPRLRIRLPERVRFASGDVVGPSAGLAFALTLYDAKDHDADLTQGRNIVATGQLSLDGEVLEVGGIRQKAIAAQRFSSDHGRIQLMLVPQGNVDEARQAVAEFCRDDHPCVRVVGIDSVESAVRILLLDPRVLEQQTEPNVAA